MSMWTRKASSNVGCAGWRLNRLPRSSCAAAWHSFGRGGQALAGLRRQAAAGPRHRAARAAGGRDRALVFSQRRGVREIRRPVVLDEHPGEGPLCAVSNHHALALNHARRCAFSTSRSGRRPGPRLPSSGRGGGDSRRASSEPDDAVGSASGAVARGVLRRWRPSGVALAGRTPSMRNRVHRQRVPECQYACRFGCCVVGTSPARQMQGHDMKGDFVRGCARRVASLVGPLKERSTLPRKHRISKRAPVGPAAPTAPTSEVPKITHRYLGDKAVGS